MIKIMTMTSVMKIMRMMTKERDGSAEDKLEDRGREG